MLQNESIVKIIDNTGGKWGQVIRILKGSYAKSAAIGDVVVIAVKDASSNGQVTKGDVRRAVIVRTRNNIARKNGTYLSFEDNAVVLINKDGNPIGKRVFGPVAKEVREKGFKAVAVLADEVI